MNAAISTHALMFFTISLPGWESLDSVRRIHSVLEGSALAFFALLVVFDVLAHLASPDEKRKDLLEKIALCCFAIAVLSEIVAYPYGQRNDTLSEQIIGSLDIKALDAASSASIALSNSREAETRSSDAVDRAGKAQEKANTARVIAGKAVTLAGIAQQRIAETKRQLNAVDAKRAELQESLINLAICNAPRVIPRTYMGNQSFADPLKPFAREAIVEFIVEPESLRATGSVEAALKEAGWTVKSIPLFNPSDWEKIPDGVEVHAYEPPPPNPNQMENWYALMASARDSEKAADKVVDFLQSYHWEAKRTWLLSPKTIPPDSLDITIGLYPANTFVVPPGEKDFVEDVTKNQKEASEMKKKMEDENDERILKNMTPQAAIEYKARAQQWKEREEKEEKESMSRYIGGPCHALNPLRLP